jgi:hypothetical protein
MKGVSNEWKGLKNSFLALFFDFDPISSNPLYNLLQIVAWISGRNARAPWRQSTPFQQYALGKLCNSRCERGSPVLAIPVNCFEEWQLWPQSLINFDSNTILNHYHKTKVQSCPSTFCLTTTCTPSMNTVFADAPFQWYNKAWGGRHESRRKCVCWRGSLCITRRFSSSALTSQGDTLALK